MAVVFPRALLREKSHSWNLASTAATPGVARTVAMVVRSDGGGFWTCTMSDVSLGARRHEAGRDRQRNATLLWRAVRQLANGGASLMVVPRNDALFVPWPAGIARGVIAIPHGDGTAFDDTTEYEQPVIDIRSDAASLRDTVLTLTIARAGSLRGGECFSILHPSAGWRMYEIGAVTYASPTRAAIRFNPPLRDDVAAGTVLEFDRPRCTMRLAAPNAMDLAVQPWTFNAASVQFVEGFDDQLQ
ncbi:MULTISPECIES: hypothetical protein [unclassified Bradyrhizobium]|uniref:hypothetical protein n=1 Tax=unclassified Bradyrhizobium TaxID=2631580 RepID=UPI002916F4FD|nr:MULTISPECIES: hypothetical protein [unclassified Bradyrhizobium]